MMKAVTNYYALNITPQLYAFSLSEDHFNSIPPPKYLTLKQPYQSRKLIIGVLTLFSFYQK